MGRGQFPLTPRIGRNTYLEKRTEAERANILLFPSNESKPSSSSKNFQLGLAQLGSWPFSIHLKIKKRLKTSQNLDSLIIMDKAWKLSNWVCKNSKNKCWSTWSHGNYLKIDNNHDTGTKLEIFLLIEKKISLVSAQKVKMSQLGLTRFGTLSARLGRVWKIPAQTHHFSICSLPQTFGPSAAFNA